MSGLEPLAALGLACNVLQLIEAAGESASLCKRIYDTGQPDPQLSDFAKNLSYASASLQGCLNAAKHPFTSEDQKLLDLAKTCQEAAKDLAQELAHLTISPGQRWASLSTTLKISGSRYKLSRLEKKLRDSEYLMETQLLLGMHKRLRISAGEMEGLDRKLQHFIQQLSAGETRLSQLVLAETNHVKIQLSNEVRLGTDSTKAHLTAESANNQEAINKHMDEAIGAIQKHVQNRDETMRQDEAYGRFLDSLHYGTLDARRNNISSTCPDTFCWIFGDNVTNDQDPDLHSDCTDDSHGAQLSSETSESVTWDRFVEWLQSPQPCYWISGKPASGKSVLMKFIVSHPRTMAELKKWESEVRILSHFFWRPGGIMQKNFKGLLCSLSYQTLVHDKPFAIACLQRSPHWNRKRTDDDWDVDELRNLLVQYFGQTTQAFCIFLDGLDEFWHEDGVQHLLNFLGRLQEECPLIKMCVSSRREHALENRLGQNPQLRMQDLTTRDISRYATTTLNKAKSFIPIRIDHLTDVIVQKAEGVFLWAVLVARSLARGIEASDSEDELDRRLSSTPGDLYDLFRDMWKRLNDDSKIYRDTSALLLNIATFAALTSHNLRPRKIRFTTARFHSRVSIFELMAATSDDILDLYLAQGERLAPTDLAQRCQRTCNMIMVRSAGLLEARSEESLKTKENDTNSDVLPYQPMMVEFVHRTALDFLANEEDGRRLRQEGVISESQLCSRLYRAYLVKDIMWPHLATRGWIVEDRENMTESQRRLHFISKNLELSIASLKASEKLLSAGDLEQFLQTTRKYFDRLRLDRHDKIPPTTSTNNTKQGVIFAHPLKGIWIDMSFWALAAAFGHAEFLVKHLFWSEEEVPSDILRCILFRCIQTDSPRVNKDTWTGRHRIMQDTVQILCSHKKIHSTPSMDAMSNVSAAKIAMASFLLSYIRQSEDPRGHRHLFVGSNEEIFSTLHVLCRSLNCQNDKILLGLWFNHNFGWKGASVITTGVFSLSWPDPELHLCVVVEVTFSSLVDAVVRRLAYDDAIDIGLWHKSFLGLEDTLDPPTFKVNTIFSWGQMLSVQYPADKALLSDLARSYLLPDTDPSNAKELLSTRSSRFHDQGTIILDEVFPRTKARMRMDKFIEQRGGKGVGLRLCKRCISEEHEKG